MIGINGRLDVVQLQVNHLWNWGFVNHDASIVPASLICNPVAAPMNANIMHTPLPNEPSQAHTSLVHSLLSGGTFDSSKNLVNMDQGH